MVVSSIDFKLKLVFFIRSTQVCLREGKNLARAEFCQALEQEDWARTELQERGNCSGAQASESMPAAVHGDRESYLRNSGEVAPALRLWSQGLCTELGTY